MAELKGKVATVLTYFQASLYAHLVAVAKNRDTAYPSLGSLPFDYEDEVLPMSPVRSKLNSSLDSRSRLDSSLAAESHREEPPQAEELVTFQNAHNEFTDSEVVWRAESQSTELGDLPKCVIRKRYIESPDLVDTEMTYSDFEEYIEPQPRVNVSKALLRSRLNAAAEAKPARYDVEAELPKFEPVPVDKPAAKTLYAEVITTVYSLGGDGFALHPGDIVMVLQFLTDYGLVECRWEGLQGLFPVHTVRVMAPEAEKPKFSGKILAIAQRELLNVISRPEATTPTYKPSKLLTRLKQREKTPS